jgi:deoxyribodipyrimidine photolyase
MNYYIFLSYNFRLIDNPIFDLIKNPDNIVIIYVRRQNNYVRKNEILDDAWDAFAIKLMEIGILCYEFNGSAELLNDLIKDIKKKNNKNIVLEDTPRLLFPLLDKEYKLCRPFLNYNLKNNKVELVDSESFFDRKYRFEKKNLDYLHLKIYKKNDIKHKNEEKKDIQAIWKKILNSDLIPSYAEKRDYLDGQYTSHLSLYINSGQISIRQIWNEVDKKYGNTIGGAKFLSELGWRDFAYHQFQYHPHMTWKNLRANVTIAYKNDNKAFEQWKNGNTGYRIIDAGMNQLNQTGWISNRIRMLVASFLTKNLQISWQQGAEYFLEKLIDADPIINALNWQWVAGTGTDHMPHFRIFNPVLQAKKYDKDEIYQNKWA